MKNFDLLMFLMMIVIPVFCFIEIGLMWGFIVLGFLSLMFLIWFNKRAQFFS
jgi:hypothetical protein